MTKLNAYNMEVITRIVRCGCGGEFEGCWTCAGNGRYEQNYFPCGHREDTDECQEAVCAYFYSFPDMAEEYLKQYGVEFGVDLRERVKERLAENDDADALGLMMLQEAIDRKRAA